MTVRDASSRARFGCKGPAAESFLHERGCVVPPGANSWAADEFGVCVARLATSEFLIEALDDSVSEAQTKVAAIAASLLDPAARVPGVYPVLRQDCVLELTGARVNELLVQVCNVDFQPLARNATASGGPLVLTSMIGVGVTVIARLARGECVHSIWCDPSFGHYVRTTLEDISRELDN